jgi:transposase
MTYRKQPKSPMARYTLQDFLTDFPDDATCLEWLREYLYPDGILCKRCGMVTKHHRVQSRPSYSCDRCGRHEHPTSGTIFHGSRTSLRQWFYAIFLMAQTRCGISAKQLERELGVTYKTAWRMFHQIRSLLVEDADEGLGGSGEPVEVDTTYVGGRPRHRITGDQPRAIREAMSKKIEILGMVERHGSVRAVVNPTGPLMGNVMEHVLPSALIYTDEAMAFSKAAKYGYAHRRINHSERVYVSGDVHTNTIEGFWSLVKRGIGGVYHSVSAKHLQMYLDEYTFRYNHRMDVDPMFQTFLRQVAKGASD